MADFKLDTEDWVEIEKHPALKRCVCSYLNSARDPGFKVHIKHMFYSALSRRACELRDSISNKLYAKLTWSYGRA